MAGGLAAVFLSGIIFLLLTFTGAREKIIESILRDFRMSIAAGIGMLIVFIGLQGSGLIVAHPSTLVTLGDFSKPTVMLALFGIIVTIFFYSRRWKTAIFAGIVVTAIVGMIAGIIPIPDNPVSVPPAPPAGAFMEGFGTVGLDFRFFVVTFTILILDIFDTAGTLMAVGEKAGLVDSDGKLRDASKALAADSIATVAGGILGTSTVT